MESQTDTRQKLIPVLASIAWVKTGGPIDLNDLYVIWHVFAQAVAFWGSQWLHLH